MIHILFTLIIIYLCFEAQSDYFESSLRQSVITRILSTARPVSPSGPIRLVRIIICKNESNSTCIYTSVIIFLNGI